MDLVREYLQSRGYETVEADFYTQIDEWHDWFVGALDAFHKISFYNGITTVNREVKMLGMAKTVCETWANLEMNERVHIGTGDETQDEKLIEVLTKNKFWKNANRLCELYFALGTGAFVEYIDNGKIKIDYVRADMIFPLAWDSTGITECAFASIKHIGKMDYTYLQMHTINESGKYVIENHLLSKSKDGIIVDSLPEDTAETFETNSEVPFFQIVTTNIINNYDLDNPMGVSVFGNAIDILKELDTTFDALDIEIYTGRRMVFLSADQFFVDKDGVERNTIAKGETVIRFLGGMDDQMIKDYSPTLRTKDLIDTIQFQLNLLSEKCGMGTNTFEFTPSGVKTATEIISEDSDLYQNLKKHEIVLQEALEGLILAIAALSSTKEINDPITVTDIQINFDDSIIQDKEAERKQYKEEVAMGTMSEVEYRMRVYNEDEETAKSKVPVKADVMP